VAHVAIQAWESPLLSGQDAALRYARRTVTIARMVRQARPIAWQSTHAHLLIEAGNLRRALASGRVGMRVLERA